MSTLSQAFTPIEERLANMQAKAALKREEVLTRYRASGRDWRSTVGAFQNDADYDNAMKQGRKWREESNQEPIHEGFGVQPGSWCVLRGQIVRSPLT
jgi:hypothetical protein